jgi:tetratricopeptide (TPR) repeat protein
MRLILGTVSGLLAALVAWQGYEYVASAQDRAENQVQAGVKLLNAGLFDQSIPKFNSALQANPNSWNAYFQRGVAKQSLNAVDDALSDYQAALKLKPDLFAARTASAGIFNQKGDSLRAVAELTKVIDGRPGVDAYYRRGLALVDLGRHEEAIRDFSWVIEQVRDAPFAYYARATAKRAIGDSTG